jgi:DNA-directed RNA polymerase specialized sigma subunit
MVKYVSPELYEKYKQRVLEMSLAIQNYVGTIQVRETSSLTDREIADRLGLGVADVTEIRCMAEIDLLPADTWLKSANWKQAKTQRSSPKRAKQPKTK